MEKLRGQVVRPPDVGVLVIRLCYRKQAVVANLFFPLQLLTFDDTDEARTHHDAGKGRLIHEQQHIDRVAIGRERLRKKAEVVGKYHARGQNLFEGKDSLFWIVGKLVAASLRGLNNDLKDIAVLLVYRL